MNSPQSLLDLDYLVYSSHKTATQTVTETLKANGYTTTFCHSLDRDMTRLNPGTFRWFLLDYHRKNGKKLDVVTTFRQPIERIISAFFQWYGQAIIFRGHVADVSQTIVATDSIPELQALFLQELREEVDGLGNRVRLRESIDQICGELGIATADLPFDPERHVGKLELEHCVIHTLEFDYLIRDDHLEELLSEITGKAVVRRDANISSRKWYYGVQTEFKSALTIPPDLVIGFFELRRALLEAFYPGRYDQLLESALHTYG